MRALTVIPDHTAVFGLRNTRHQELSSASVRLLSHAEEMHIVGMPVTDEQDISSVDALLALPEDGCRHELLDGVHVVTPAPRPQHQQVVANMLTALRSALHDRDDLTAYPGPADIQLGPKTLVQPDVLVLHHAGPAPTSWTEAGVPVLAIEIISPTTAARDRGVKRRIYQQATVGEYWIVDVDARLVERWRPTDERPEILDRVVIWRAPKGSEVEVDLGVVFAELPT